MEQLQEVVTGAYRALLGREPENDDVISQYSDATSIEQVIASVAGSSEAQSRVASTSSPFEHFSSIFDAREVMRRHAVSGLVPEAGILQNFLGVKIEEDYLPDMLTGMAGMVEPIPFPANWHADIAEWAAALRAVDLASDTFTVAELGCGWGCWLNNTGVAARNRGLRTTLIGVEGDEGHIGFARRCAALNGFAPTQTQLIRGIAASRAGVALFARQDVSGTDWGLEPIFGATPAEREAAVATGKFDELPMITVEEIIGEHPFLDLLHIDIQGGEMPLVADTVETLNKRVAYMVIGTHSRVIEGQLLDALGCHDWQLEIERPLIAQLGPNGPITLVDGVQGWRNMTLRPQ